MSTGESYTNNYTLPTGADTYYLSETDYNLAKNSQVVEKPMSIEGLDEYESGTTEQTVSISSNEYYTVSGCTSATEDGIYTFTLSLNDKYDAETNTTGYVWSDGTTDDVTYMWYIGEATAASDEELSALSTALTSAQSALAEIQTSITAGDVVLSEDGSDVLPANKWISQAALNAAQAAIDAAGGVADSTHVTAATSALTTATAALVAADGTHVHSYTTELTERTVDATCTETGEKTMQCSCGATQTETISATGHTAGAEATCTTAQVCTVCKAELKAATGHTAGAAATCTTAQVCTVCNAELAAATGHTAGAAATCTTAQVCTVCNAELTAATGHNWVKGVCTNNCGTDGKAQAITVKASTSKTYKGTKNIKKKKLKKAQTFTISASATGAVSFKKVSSTSSKISINSKGKVTVKKGLKAGTYTLKAKVSAAASGEYKAASKTITIKVVVKKK